MSDAPKSKPKAFPPRKPKDWYDVMAAAGKAAQPKLSKGEKYYAKITKRFPEAANDLTPGMIGGRTFKEFERAYLATKVAPLGIPKNAPIGKLRSAARKQLKLEARRRMGLGTAVTGEAASAFIARETQKSKAREKRQALHEILLRTDPAYQQKWAAKQQRSLERQTGLEKRQALQQAKAARVKALTSVQKNLRIQGRPIEWYAQRFRRLTAVSMAKLSSLGAHAEAQREKITKSATKVGKATLHGLSKTKWRLGGAVAVPAVVAGLITARVNQLRRSDPEAARRLQKRGEVVTRVVLPTVQKVHYATQLARNLVKTWQDLERRLHYTPKPRSSG